MMMMVQVMSEALRRRVMERFPTSGIGLQIAEQIEEADLSARQQLVAERERLTAAFEHSLPPLDAAISKAQKAAEKTRQAYLAADLVLRKADSARHAVAMTYDRERGDINATLRGSSSQAIDAFQVELRERDEVNRTGFLGDLIAWEDGVYGTSKSVFFGSARTCRPDGRGAPGGPRLRVGGAAVGGAEARLHGGDAAEGGCGRRSVMLGIGRA